MAEQWERREARLSLVRVTYVIRAGAGWDVVQRALHQATAEWRELSGVDVDAEVPPEAVTWQGLGQDIRVHIEVEVEESDTEPEPVGDQPALSVEEEQDG